MPLDEALRQLLANAEPVLPAETVAIYEAAGRILREDVVSALDIPPRDNSAMDGYALRVADCPQAGVVLPVSQRIPAGQPGEPLQAGSAARIFTGAQVPAGADAIVMQEQAEALDDGRTVRIRTVPLVGQWIRRRGEDVRRGAVVLGRGQGLGGAETGLAASLGVDGLQVGRRPRVAMFSTGDELVLPGEVAPQDMEPGKIYNSSRYFLHTLLQGLGCELSDLGIVPDSLDATVATLRQAAASHDVLLTSGGVSVGEEDHVKPAVEQLGELDLWKIAIKPGKPFAYGRIARTRQSPAHFMGLPGNPVSSFLTFLLLVRPFLLRLQGAQNVEPMALPMRADFELTRTTSRREFLRVRLNDRGGLDLFPNQSSGVLTSMHWADGVVDHPPRTTIAQGDLVRFIPFRGLIA